tara:strand:+ start:1826 stop:2230 length:405 start_codon:yes stop_codon:yes gene_type:complete
MALGLFAIFGIIRYRTETVLPEEITYLFVTIGLSVINALTAGGYGWITLIIINVSVCISVLFAEKYLFHADDINSRDKLILNIPFEQNNINNVIKNSIETIENDNKICVKTYNINKIDYETNIIQIHVFYNKNS